MAGTGGLTPRQQVLLQRVLPLIPQAPLVVAMGGGADSAVCAWAAASSGSPARAISVDHGLPASAALVAAAKRAAACLGLEHRVVPAAGSGDGESELREARYQALEAAAAADEVLLTGHTRDDQAETVLGNLLRGAGAGGLSGIPRHRGRWCRPLLDVSRAEARAVADELGLPYADDPGNLDLGRRRNRLRLEIIPLLESRFGHEVRRALARAADLLADDDAELERRASTIEPRRDEEGLHLPAAVLATLPLPVASRVVRRTLRCLFPPYAGEQEHVAAVLEVARGGAAALPLEGGRTVSRRGPWVTLHPAEAPPLPDPVVLPVPGSAVFGGWIVVSDILPRPPVPRPPGRRHALLPAAVAEAGLLVRAPAPGDSLPLERGSKPVMDALREAGVPAGRDPAGRLSTQVEESLG